MTIAELLKTDESVRISISDRWMIFDNIYKLWTIYERKRGRKYSSIKHITEDEQEAVAYLLDK
jgi:hypothetical protein